jgi:hypothetical protein
LGQPRLEAVCFKAWRTVSYDTDSTISSATSGIRARVSCVQGGVQPGGGVVLAHPGNGGEVDLQRVGDHLVGPAGASLALVGFEQDTGMGQGTGPTGALGDQGV